VVGEETQRVEEAQQPTLDEEMAEPVEGENLLEQAQQLPGQRGDTLAAAAVSQRQRSLLALDLDTQLAVRQGQRQAQRLRQQQRQDTRLRQQNVVQLQTPTGTGTPTETMPRDTRTPYRFGTPTTPSEGGRTRPRGGGLDDSPDPEDEGQAARGGPDVAGTGRGAGWWNETLAAVALGPTAEGRGSPGESVLEDRPRSEQFTSTLPVEAQVEGTEEQQEAVEEAEAFFAFGGGESEDAPLFDLQF